MTLRNKIVSYTYLILRHLKGGITILTEKYLPGGALNPYWVLEQKQELSSREEDEIEDELLEAIKECSVTPDEALLEMCKVIPASRLPISLEDELETKFNFIKRHSDSPEDLQLAREIAGLPR